MQDIDRRHNGNIQNTGRRVQRRVYEIHCLMDPGTRANIASTESQRYNDARTRKASEQQAYEPSFHPGLFVAKVGEIEKTQNK